MIYTDKIHLVADSLEELHQFAERIGLKREWFQDHKIPHYDLKGYKINEALRNGATLLPTKELIRQYRGMVYLEYSAKQQLFHISYDQKGFVTNDWRLLSKSVQDSTALIFTDLMYEKYHNKYLSVPIAKLEFIEFLEKRRNKLLKNKQ